MERSNGSRKNAERIDFLLRIDFDRVIQLVKWNKFSSASTEWMKKKKENRNGLQIGMDFARVAMRSDRSVSLCCDWSNCSQSPESDGTSLDRVFDSDRQCYRVLSSVVVGFFVGFSLFFFFIFFLTFRRLLWIVLKWRTPRRPAPAYRCF